MNPTSISIDELRILAPEKGAITLLDVRTPDEFDEAHVPGARSLPLGSLDAAGILDGKTVSRTRPLYLICHTQNRSRIAAERFVSAGHPRVTYVLGGTAGWIAAGLPVVGGEPSSQQASAGSPGRSAKA